MVVIRTDKPFDFFFGPVDPRVPAALCLTFVVALRPFIAACDNWWEIVQPRARPRACYVSVYSGSF
jgi:hypothetical protein